MIDSSLSFYDKNIVITGATGGIGRELTSILGKMGAKLFIGSRNEKKLEKLASTIKMQGGNINYYPLDVTNESTVLEFSNMAVQHLGSVSTLINLAGVGAFSTVLESKTEDFDKMIAVNLRGTYLCCKYFGKHMVNRRSGHIINLASIAGTTPLPECGSYSASKYGVIGLTKVMQVELRKKGIQVTCVIPGAVNSSFWDTIPHKPDRSLMISASNLAKYFVFLLSQPKGVVVDDITIMPPTGIL